MNKKLMSLVSLNVVICICLTGCTWLNPDQSNHVQKETNVKSKNKIVFSSNRTDLQNTLIPKWIEAFNASHPDVQVSVETVSDYQGAIKVKMASNDMPDIWTIHNGYYTKMQLQHFNSDVSKFEFAKDFMYTEMFSGIDGGIYGLPQGSSCTGILYNKKIFAELGIQVPKTLDEFIAAGKKINASGKIGLATAAKAGWPLQYWWLDIMNNIAGDGGYRNKIAQMDEPFSMDSPAMKSFTVLKRFNDEGILEKQPLDADWEQMKMAFANGEVGMFMLGPWFSTQVFSDKVKIEDIGMFPFPYDNSGQINIIPGPDVALGISKNSANMDAAEDFYIFMMDTNYAGVVSDLGLLSARKSVNIEVPLVKEFNSYPTTRLTATMDSQQYNEKISKSKIDYNKVAQDVLSGKDLNALSAELNQKWKKSR